MKTELVYHNKYQTREEAELSIFEYIDSFYNTKKKTSTIRQLDHFRISKKYLITF
ncbi:MAG: IS3 family transposase [Bacteroidetes bacterium]|nr:IS3 family transposase [Bacteroidota bacterium]